MQIFKWFIQSILDSNTRNVTSTDNAVVKLTLQLLY